MNFWQVVMLMAWLALFAVFIWARIAVFIDVANRSDVSGVGTVGWIVLVLLLPIVGILLYIWRRPKLTVRPSPSIPPIPTPMRSPRG